MLLNRLLRSACLLPCLLLASAAPAETRPLVEFQASPEASRFVLSLDPSGQELRITSDGSLVQQYERAAVDRLRIVGNERDNTLTVDFSFGNPIPPQGLTFDGQLRGEDFDTLDIGGSTFESTSHAAINPHDGRYLLASGGTTYTIDYLNLEPVIDNVNAVNREFTFVGGAETITLSDDGGAGDGFSLVDSTLGELVVFLNPTASLLVDAGTGADLVDLVGLDSLFAATIEIDGDGDETIRVGGALPAIFAAPDDVTFMAGQTLQVDLNGNTPGADQDQLLLAGGADITGMILEPLLGFAPPVGTAFTIIDAQAGLTGTFAGLPEGETFEVTGTLLQISYAGDKVVLTVIPAPTPAPRAGCNPE